MMVSNNWKVFSFLPAAPHNLHRWVQNILWNEDHNQWAIKNKKDGHSLLGKVVASNNKSVSGKMFQRQEDDDMKPNHASKARLAEG